MHAFAPKGQNDFIAIFPKKYTIQDLDEHDWTDFAEGLKGIFQTLIEQGLLALTWFCFYIFNK